MQNDIKDGSAQGEREVAGQSDAPVPHLLFLKLMVGGLSVAMVLGLAVIVVILWIRLSEPPLPELPASVELPANTSAEAVTFAGNRLIVLTDRDEVLIYDADGSLQQTITLDQP
ncbi:DUF6476 family protein [Paracoccus aerodenitrificans]|uniref:DUF6476 family protein n=1 Tax=Paracoccus aerodenitrificans TaxID=3017781 RepID=UPI0022F01058|nr:DUF6476 family protein [Paracoccus aerodenitrificans]WBU64471.1 DUF6476 family protein [Paracoccus aerodenitrificans]